MSNYFKPSDSEYAYEVEDEPVQRTPCKPCFGTGTVEIDGWESDCIECEGWGDVPVSA